MKTVVRVNGTGSAWPVMIGDSHPLYSTGRVEDLANASYSLIHFNGNEPKTGKIEWEAMIDMGHHTIPYLIRNENRIPEIVALTHGHPDHFFGVDWVVQSYYTKYGIRKKYPIYTTKPVWESVLRTFGYLNQIAELKELLPGVKTQVEEIEGLTITAFPVFHGDTAIGASMLFFENNASAMKPVLFTGDMLCPLWRKKDLFVLQKTSLLYIDSTNRFPFPGCNHMSFTNKMPASGVKSHLLTEWLNKISITDLIVPQMVSKPNKTVKKYFEEFLSDWKSHAELTYCITDFLKLIPVKSVNLVHYAGTEDRKLYNQQIFGKQELKEWAEKTALEEGITKNTLFCYPEVGQLFDLLI
jgi:hypothetical protein